MHVIARCARGSCRLRARRSACSSSSAHVEILRRGELAIVLRAFDQGHIEAEPFGDARIVGELARRLVRRGAMRGEDRLEAETLRRLRAPQLIALDRAGHAAPARPLQRVGDGQAGEGALMRVETVDDAGDQRRVDEGPRRVVDQHRGGRFAAPAPRARRAPSPAAVAPPGTAVRKRAAKGALAAS